MKFGKGSTVPAKLLKKHEFVKIGSLSHTLRKISILTDLDNITPGRHAHNAAEQLEFHENRHSRSPN
jgi:hypothetical protein